VLFLDEIDALQDAALISVLRKLRDGYPERPVSFSWSLALVEMRDVRDDKVASGGGDRLNTASPFNIKTEPLTLRAFTAAEVAELTASTPPAPARSSPFGSCKTWGCAGWIRPAGW